MLTFWYHLIANLSLLLPLMSSSEQIIKVPSIYLAFIKQAGKFTCQAGKHLIQATELAKYRQLVLCFLVGNALMATRCLAVAHSLLD